MIREGRRLSLELADFMQPLTGELIRQPDVMTEIEGQRPLIEQTMMQGAKCHGVGDRARPSGCVPANMRSVETNNAVAEAEAEAAERATAPIGLEDFIGDVDRRGMLTP